MNSIVSYITRGEVIINDGSSKYSLVNKAVFRVDCTVDTNLIITITPNEGQCISSIDSIGNEGVISGSNSVTNSELNYGSNSWNSIDDSNKDNLPET